MGFYEINIQDEIQKRKSESTAFARAWEDSREEYRLIGEMIALRKQEEMTQTKMAELLGSSQQVVSRIEKKKIVHRCGCFVICYPCWGMN